MHGRRIVAGGHRKEHGQRLVHGATWEVGRVGAVAENVGSMEQRWVDYWEKNREKRWKNKVGGCWMFNQSWWNVGKNHEQSLILMSWAIEFQGPAKQKLGLLRVTLPDCSNQNNVLIFQVLSSDLCLLVQKGSCLHRLDLLKLPSQNLFQIPWLLYHEPSANLRHGV